MRERGAPPRPAFSFSFRLDSRELCRPQMGWKDGRDAFSGLGRGGRGGRCAIVMHVAIRTLDYFPGREVEGTCKINPGGGGSCR